MHTWTQGTDEDSHHDRTARNTETHRSRHTRNVERYRSDGKTQDDAQEDGAKIRLVERLDSIA